MKKKLLSVVLSTAMVASMLVGCGSSSDSAETAAPADTATEDTAAAATDDAAPADDTAAASI